MDVKHQLPVAEKTNIVLLPSQNAQFHGFIPIAPKDEKDSSMIIRFAHRSG